MVKDEEKGCKFLGLTVTQEGHSKSNWAQLPNKNFRGFYSWWCYLHLHIRVKHPQADATEMWGSYKRTWNGHKVNSIWSHRQREDVL